MSAFETETVEAMVARVMAECKKSSAAMAPEPPLSVGEHLTLLRTRDALRDAALAFGVKRRALSYVVWHAERAFTLRDDGTTLVPKDGRPHPQDPCVLLDVVTWLEEMRRTEGLLFDVTVNQ